MAESEPKRSPPGVQPHLSISSCLLSQIQQMADNIAVDIDKQLAAKTKELLG